MTPRTFRHNRYGWAVALIVIFCILVIVAFVIWLVVWLFNRSKDKQQKRELYEHYEENNYSGVSSKLSYGNIYQSIKM